MQLCPSLLVTSTACMNSETSQHMLNLQVFPAPLAELLEVEIGVDKVERPHFLLDRIVGESEANGEY